MGDLPLKSENAKRAAVLRIAVKEAQEALEKARMGYEHALAVAADTQLSSDGMFALRRQGREYADAVKRYSGTVMAWVSFMETVRADALSLISKTATSETPVTDLPAEPSLQNKQFVLHSSLLGMRLLSRQKLVILPRRTRGTVRERFGAADEPRLVLIDVEQEQFLVWRRDLEECAEFLE